MLILGVIVLCVGVMQIFTLRFTVAARSERWLSPVLGTTAGILNGFFSLNGPVTIPYLLSLGLGRDGFVAAIAIIFLMATLPLYGTLIYNGVLSTAALVTSATALVPVFAVVAVGMRFRARMSERTLTRLLGILLLAAGANLIRRGLGF